MQIVELFDIRGAGGSSGEELWQLVVTLGTLQRLQRVVQLRAQSHPASNESGQTVQQQRMKAARVKQPRCELPVTPVLAEHQAAQTRMAAHVERRFPGWQRTEYYTVVLCCRQSRERPPAGDQHARGRAGQFRGQRVEKLIPGR